MSRPAAAATQIVDLRGKLPTRAGTSYLKRPLEYVDSIDLHYSASDVHGQVADIARYQTGQGAQEPFPAIAYHFVVTSDGTVSWCHDLEVRTWHNGAAGQNARAIAICYIGNYEPNELQIVGIADAITWCQLRLGRRLAVAGHKDSYPTLCPGLAWPRWAGLVQEKVL